MFAARNMTFAKGVTSGMFDPLSLSPALWLDASDSSTLYDATTGGSLVAADGTVARWEDKSGNARHGTQATSGSRPLRKTAIKNSLDVVRFDGSNDTMLGSLTLPAPFSIFVVYATTSTTANAYIFELDPVTAIIKGYVDGETEYFQDPRLSAGSVAADTFGINAVVYPSSGTVKTYKNGTEIASGTAATPTTSASYYLGSSRGVGEFLGGDIAEILVFPTALSDTERGDVETYLNSKWAIF